jgi:hypothetical protein
MLFPRFTLQQQGLALQNSEFAGEAAAFAESTSIPRIVNCEVLDPSVAADRTGTAVLAHRYRLAGSFVVIAIVSIWIASVLIPAFRYTRGAQRINDKIVSLMERRPREVDATPWNQCVTWASIAHCNICFSEGHTSFMEMSRFELELDERLQRDVRPDTIRWIFERLAQTGPTGQRYIQRFKDDWSESLAEITRQEN